MTRPSRDVVFLSSLDVDRALRRRVSFRVSFEWNWIETYAGLSDVCGVLLSLR